MLSEKELAAQKALTRAFVNADRVQVLANRFTISADGAGGYTKTASTALPVFWANLMAARDTAFGSERQSLDGRSVRATHLLIVESHTDIRRWDELVVNQTVLVPSGVTPPRYEVVWVEDLLYEKRVEVIFLG